MATFFRPSPSNLTPSGSLIRPDLFSKRFHASRSAQPADLFVRSSDPSCPTDNGTAIEAQSESRTRAMAGCFTEEKAKQLRRKTVDVYAFHDVMYHSAIASRLATDVSCPSRFE